VVSIVLKHETKQALRDCNTMPPHFIKTALARRLVKSAVAASVQFVAWFYSRFREVARNETCTLG
jgi:hypothetical protein